MQQPFFNLAFAAMLAVTPVAGQPATDATLAASVQKTVDRYLASRAKPEHISAISVSISLHGNPTNINVASGRTEYGGAGTPVTTDMLYQIGSNTKAFTSVALLQLEAEGKLSIEDPIGKWLPEYPAWRSVTIHRLLDMTSGIMGYDNVPEMEKGLGSTLLRRWSVPQLVGFADPVYPGAPKPTTGWNYSNTNYLLAQMIIERITGESYASVIDHRFFGPLGLTDTFYSADLYPATVTDRMVSGYFFNTDPGNEPLRFLLGRDVKRSDMSWAQGAGGIVSTSQDVTRWVRALYAGDLLPATQRRELMTIVSDKTGKPIASTSMTNRVGFGLGVGQLTNPKFGLVWYYQGETLGYRMLYGWFPKTDVVIALGLNSQPPGKENLDGKLLEDIYADIEAAGTR